MRGPHPILSEKEIIDSSATALLISLLSDLKLIVYELPFDSGLVQDLKRIILGTEKALRMLGASE